MTTEKHRIMEVLLTTENKLSKSDIDWAIANIPDNTVHEPVPFDHNKKSVFEACGLPESLNSKVMEEYQKIKNDDAIDKKSQIIEAIVNTGSQALIRSFVIRGVMEFEETTEKSALQALKKLLDKMKGDE